MKTTFAKPAAIAALVAAAAVSPAMADKHNLWTGNAATYDFQNVDNWNVKDDIEKYPNDELGGKYLNVSFWKSIKTVDAAKVEFSKMFTMNGTLTIANYASGNPPLVFTAGDPTFGLDLTLSPNNQNKGSIYIAHTNQAYNTSNYYVGLNGAKVEFYSPNIGPQKVTAVGTPTGSRMGIGLSVSIVGLALMLQDLKRKKK